MCIITPAFQAIFVMADDYKLKRYRFTNMIIIILALYTKHHLFVKLMDIYPPLSILKVPSVKYVLFVFCCTQQPSIPF